LQCPSYEYEKLREWCLMDECTGKSRLLPRMKEKLNAYRIWLGGVKESNSVENIGLTSRIIVILTLNCSMPGRRVD
jgi:hypothetical protein